jgi:N-glycosylase/DNA lyase
MRLRLVSPLHLEATLHSGQAFRWRPQADGWHEGFIRNRACRVRADGRHLIVQAERGLTTDDVLHYFRLDGSHERFLAEVRRDAALDRALAAYPGLRLLAQDPWEVLVAYIVSANSNVGKIARTLELVANQCGVVADGVGRARFPMPDQLVRLTEADLRTTGMGYRAPYVAAAARLAANGDLDVAALARLPYDEAHEQLLGVPGVGPKVADCILLYGCGHVGAFPVDVWVARVLRADYFPRKRLRAGEVGAWARRHFGPWAGYAQHYLFHERRSARPPATAAAHAARRRVAVTSSATRARTTRGGGVKVTPS